ncbi:MAG: MFS transporter [Candidatus Thorarchaeota archaeon]|nr:MAG: MFS transporter [Candidatus Thorarchaeota archaeon]
MRPFFIMWSGQAASLLGTSLVQFVLVWWLTLTTGSATVLAFATIAALIPQVLLTPLAGAFVDRHSRRAIMIVADTIAAAPIVPLMMLYYYGLIEVWHIYLAMFVRASASAFHWPAMEASTTMLVPKKHLARIGGLNQALYGASSVVAPPIGAVLFVTFPMYGLLAIDIVTASLAVSALAFIHIPQPVRQALTKDSGVLGDMLAGFRFLRVWKGALVLMFVAMLINFLISPAFGLLPILVAENFAGDAPMLAAMESVMGICTVLGGVILGAWGGSSRRVVTAVWSLAISGIATTIIGLAPLLVGPQPWNQYELTLGMVSVVGFLLALVNGCLMAILQATIPPDMQGRVFSLISSGAGAMMPLGYALAGPLADAFGVQFWFILSGVVTFATGLACVFMPSVMEIEKTPIQSRKTVAELAELVDTSSSDTDTE